VQRNKLTIRNKTFAYFLSTLLPHLPDLFPSTIAQRHAFGPGTYLMQGHSEAQALEMERRDAEVWGFTAALAVNAPEEEQASLVGALREKILHTVSGARQAQTSAERGELMRRNVNMFLNGLVSVQYLLGHILYFVVRIWLITKGLDASMIE
jgi:DNA topoisomerase 2-associated protein PAT1